MEQTTETKLEPKLCEACGETFGCGAKIDGCWCAEIELTDEKRNELLANYRNCLCNNCLQEFQKKT